MSETDSEENRESEKMYNKETELLLKTYPQRRSQHQMASL